MHGVWPCSNVSTFEKSTFPGFHTGPGDCLNVEGFCKFSLLDSTRHQMVVSESKKMTVRSGMMDCKVNVSMVLIGMGGTCHIDMFDQCNKNAGGSGFVSRFFAILDPSKSINDIMYVWQQYLTQKNLMNVLVI